MKTNILACTKNISYMLKYDTLSEIKEININFLKSVSCNILDLNEMKQYIYRYII